MKFDSITAIAMASFLKLVNANFDLHRVVIGGTGMSGNSEGWQVYEGDANCDNKLDWLWVDSKEVSGGKYGVRCEGDGCGRNAESDPANIDIAEMNFNSAEHHWK